MLNSEHGGTWFHIAAAVSSARAMLPVQATSAAVFGTSSMTTLQEHGSSFAARSSAANLHSLTASDEEAQCRCAGHTAGAWAADLQETAAGKEAWLCRQEPC